MLSIRRNDPRQYDALADEWWRPGGGFELLHWLAAARAGLIPPAPGPGRVLLDAGCGGGLLAPHVRHLGYRHVGADLRPAGLLRAAEREVLPVAADVAALPLADAIADVVVAGEILEHVTDLRGTVAELCRVLRPGGLVVLDTVNATALSRFVTVTLGERFGLAPVGVHDPALFVAPARLRSEFARHGVRLAVRGVRPSVPGLVRWLAARGAPDGRPLGRMVPTFSTAVLYQGIGRKPTGRPPAAASSSDTAAGGGRGAAVRPEPGACSDGGASPPGSGRVARPARGSGA
ncbi:2-polyprenyl-6-hydroxyphenyl methylase/3-demethylubiquinone-9 3-methyltransferase [Actinoplanes teichomyceticus]|uniref:2-polyprenyl-6-hydroxyphenyl methylase/3-demethylubiquinone-9 3-methyltransferase n=1 Tax=Actinoplanes teichomyceticus TaxID=1867 RepID=A0A561WQG5_ACTTI|nr:methyltransferase domain-containing protein [Actinoplanes teichomyceticus]TWG26103.1 2-polyprenyl-6-hydroxyphenyl methylase/3-demethylubiquinone-9 3-methyltransferase [Actinoplanes teichomyceticus]